MPLLILGLLIDVALVLHVVKTGRSTTWIWIVVMLPMAGPIAYFVVELMPELTRSRAARKVVSSAKRTIDPQGDLRRAHLRLRANDSIESRRRVADELCASGRFGEALEYYRQALTGLYEHDPHLLLGMARAQFELGDASNARETLDRLRKENPEFKSSDGHLLYARALEAEGDLPKARDEFAALAGYYPGAEAKYRYAMLLKQMNDKHRADEVLVNLLNDAELSTKHYRRAQKEWLSLAKKELGK